MTKKEKKIALRFTKLTRNNRLTKARKKKNKTKQKLEK